MDMKTSIEGYYSIEIRIYFGREGSERWRRANPVRKGQKPPKVRE